MQSRLRLVVAAVGVLAGLASIAARITYQRALDSPNHADWVVFPWTVWLDVVVLLALGVGIVLLIQPRARPDDWERPPLVQPGLPLLALAGVAAWRFGLVAAVLLLVGAVGVAWVAPGLAGAANRRLWWPVSIGLVLRIAAAVGLSLYGVAYLGQQIVLDDEASYDFAGRQLARIMAAGFGNLDTEWRHLAGPHLDLLGLLYRLREPNFTFIRLIDAALGSVAVALVFGIGRRAWGARSGAAAAWVTAVWPLIVLWSATGLRESLALVTVLILPWLALGPLHHPLLVGKRVLRWVVAAQAALVLLWTRPESLAALTLAVALIGAGVLVSRWSAGLAPRGRLALAGGAVALLAAGVVVTTSLPGGPLGQPLSPRALEYRAAVAELTPLIEHIREKVPVRPRDDMLSGGALLRVVPPGSDRMQTVIVSGYSTEPLAYEVRLADGTTFLVPPAEAERLTDENVGWVDILDRLGEGVRLMFVPPLPWDGGPPRRVLLAPDALAWDALLVLSLVAARREYRLGNLTPARALLFAYPWLIIGGLALTSTNLGTITRHRSTLVPWLALASAPLLSAIWERAWAGLRRSRPSRAGSSPRLRQLGSSEG